MVRALQRGGENILMRVAQARAAALVVGHVAHLLLLHVHISAIPRQLMRRCGFVVELGMCGGTRLRRAVSAELRAVNCLARQIISLSLLASVGMLIAEGCHYAQLAVEKAVAVTHACVEIGAGGGVLHVQIVCCEIVGRDAVRLGAALHLIGRLLVGVAPIKRSEVAIEIHGVVAGGNVGGYLSFGGRIFHHEVYSSANAVALHVGRQRLAHLYAVEHFAGEKVEGHKAVLVVGRGNLHAVHERVVISLVHSAQNGILSLAAAVSLHRHAAHALYDAGNGDVGAKLHGFRAHHVHHVHSLVFQLPRARFRHAGIGGDNHRFRERHLVAVHAYFHAFLPLRRNFQRPVAEAGAHQCAHSSFRVDRERAVEA